MCFAFSTDSSLNFKTSSELKDNVTGLQISSPGVRRPLLLLRITGRRPRLECGSHTLQTPIFGMQRKGGRRFSSSFEDPNSIGILCLNHLASSDLIQYHSKVVKFVAFRSHVSLPLSTTAAPAQNPWMENKNDPSSDIGGVRCHFGITVMYLKFFK